MTVSLAIAVLTLVQQPGPVVSVTTLELPPFPTTPTCNSWAIRSAETLTPHQKSCYFLNKKLFSGSALFGAAFFAYSARGNDLSVERREQAVAFAKRFGTKYAQGATKSTAEYLVGMINREDPRSRPRYAEPGAPRAGIPKRIGLALLGTIWTRRDDGSHGIAYSRVAGAFASGFVGQLWTPDHLNTTDKALRRTASGFGGYISNSLFEEFQPDLARIVDRIFGR